VNGFSSRHAWLIPALFAFVLQAQPGLRSFDFTKELPAYSSQSGFGYEPGFPPGDKPFFFSVDPASPTIAGAR
jgi:hypothetical protein